MQTGHFEITRWTKGSRESSPSALQAEVARRRRSRSRRPERTQRLDDQCRSCGPGREQEVLPLIAANVVGHIRIAVQALVAMFAQLAVNGIGHPGVREKVHVAGGTNYVLGSQCQPANQCAGRTQVIQAQDDLLNLPAEPGDWCHAPMMPRSMIQVDPRWHQSRRRSALPCVPA